MARPSLDNFARMLYGMTGAEAFDRSICVRCKKDVDVPSLSEIDRREYAISSICPTCFDAIFPPEEDEA